MLHSIPMLTSKAFPPSPFFFATHVTSKRRRRRSVLTLSGSKNNKKKNGYRLYDLAIPAEEDPGKDDVTTVCEGLLKQIESKLKLKNGIAAASGIRIARKSFDARKKTNLGFRYVVEVDSEVVERAGGTRGKLREKRKNLEVIEQIDEGADDLDRVLSSSTSSTTSSKSKKKVVVIVGLGPAGLFCALSLAKKCKDSLKIVVLERGEPVERRGRAIGELFTRGKLNSNSNLCFGEGGAGTWSDGKLTTRIGRNAEEVRDCLEFFVDFGAPESILVAGKPHLGTDRMVKILRNAMI